VLGRLVNTVMQFCFQQEAGNFLIIWATLSTQTAVLQKLIVTALWKQIRGAGTRFAGPIEAALTLRLESSKQLPFVSTDTCFSVVQGFRKQPVFGAAKFAGFSSQVPAIACKVPGLDSSISDGGSYRLGHTRRTSNPSSLTSVPCFCYHGPRPSFYRAVFSVRTSQYSSRFYSIMGQ
jgi:hypothetical protein